MFLLLLVIAVDTEVPSLYFYGKEIFKCRHRGSSLRQKQFFEQRKRRQQQQVTGLDNFGDGIDRDGQRRKEHHQSLDILSFLNFSTTAQQQGSGYPGACNSWYKDAK